MSSSNENKIIPIMTPTEILEFTGLPSDFPKCNITSIFNSEYNEFVNCLGIPLLDTLNDNLTDSSCETYDNTKQYQKDDLVSYKGTLKQAIQPTIGNIPSNITYWKNAEKFKKDCLNKLWCNFLGPYIAWVIIRANIPFFYRKFSAQGMIKVKGDNFESADNKDFILTQNGASREVEKAYKNLHHYITNNNDDGCFDDYMGLAKNCCDDCGDPLDQCCCESDCEEEKEEEGDYDFG